MKKLVIGCGYLGLRVAKQWLEQGDEVFALTRTTERAEELSGMGIQPIIGNVAIENSLETFPDIQTVLYSLGYDRFSSYSRNKVVIEGLKHFLKRMPESVQKFLFTSSISLYGQSNGEWVDENSETEPSKENGHVSLEAENVVRSFFTDEQAASRNVDWSILRLAGIYGPGRVFRKVESLKAGEPIGGEPDAWLNLIHVDDACRAIINREKMDTESTLLLVSDDQPVTRRDYYQELSRIAGAPAPSFDPASSSQQRGTGLNKRCRNLKMKQELNLDLQYPDYQTGLIDILRNDSLQDH